METAISKLQSIKFEVTVFIILASFYFFAYFQRVAVPGTIFNQLQSDLQLPASTITGLGATFMYVYAGAQLFVGLFADKYGGLRVITAGGFFLCLGSLMFPLSHDTWMLYLSRAVVGVGASALFLSIIKEIDSMFGRKNFSVMLGTLYFIGYSGGMSGTLPFDRAVHCFGWRDALLGVGIITIIIYILVIITGMKTKKHKISEAKLTLKPLIVILKNKYSVPIFLAGSLNFAIYFFVQTVIGKKFLEDYVGMDSCGAASFTFIMMIFAMFTLFSSGLVSRLMGNRRKIFIIPASLLCVVNAGLMMLGLWCHWGAGFFLMCYIFSAVSSGFATVFVSTAKELNPPEYVALSTGTLNCLCYMLVAVIANVAGWILDIFKDTAVKTATSVIYPQEAYMTLFGMLLGLSTLSFIVSFFIKETNGRHVFENQNTAP